MKAIFLIIAVTIGIISPSWSQDEKLEKVHSIIKVFKEYEWYAKQFELWGEELKKNKKDADGWVNYYAAARMAKLMTTDEAEKEKWNNKMQLVTEGIEKNIRKTYEYYYIKAWDSSIWQAKGEEEEKRIASYAINAYNLDPNRADVYPDLINYYVVKGKTVKLKEIATKWRKSGDISPNILAINYNMLMSTERNSILITCGDNDTYPALVLQNAENIRTDVTVINIYMAAFSAEFRNNVFRSIGIPELNGTDLEQMAIINHIITNKGDLPLYFGFGNYFSEHEALKDQLYNVGMAMRYSETDFNNTSILINNFENKFLIDQLKFSCFKDPFPEQVKRHNMTYIPGLMMLYEHYTLMENEKKMMDTKQLITTIVVNTSYEETINSYFSNK